MFDLICIKKNLNVSIISKLTLKNNSEKFFIFGIKKKLFYFKNLLNMLKLKFI